MVRMSKKQTKIKAKKYENNDYKPNMIHINRSSNLSNVDIKQVENFAWGTKEILRGDYKKSQYGDIILPFVVLRRLGRILEPTKEKVIKELDNLKGSKPEIIEAKLNKITGYPFHNKSKFNLDLLIADPNNIHKNMKTYLRGFSENVRDVFDNFKFDVTVDELEKTDLLYQIVQHFASSELDFDPKKFDNHMMGTIYEELIRRTSEAGNEEAGDHFTPREVIKLMVNLLFSHDKSELKKKGLIRRIYDPAAGTGGMLSIADEYLQKLNPDLIVENYGQELNGESYAICKSDMMIKDLDLNKIVKGNSLTNDDGFSDEKFHYMLSNPPFGVDWGKYESKIKSEAAKGFDGKYGSGLPRKSDGSLLFLLQMISKMKPKEEGGSRIAIVLNGSPLFTGEAGSGESSIRKWIIENDMLEAIVAMPDQLFYNTGIFTYIWIVTNNKGKNRKDQIQLINASGKEFYKKMKASFGNKRKKIGEPEDGEDQIQKITKIFEDFKPGKYSKIFDKEDFGYTRITIERPLKRNFAVNKERLAILEEKPAFKKLDGAKKKEPSQKEILATLKKLPTKTYKDYVEFSKDLKSVFVQTNLFPSSSLIKVIEDALSERDETANEYFKKENDVHPVHDSELRDYENVPLKENIDDYFEKEVQEYVKNAWIDDSTRDKVGYEIPFTQHFYEYKPLRPLGEINDEIKQLQKEISEGLEELMD